MIIECVSMSPGIRAVHKDYPQFTIDQAGYAFNHSQIHATRDNAHMHMSYQAVDGSSLFWVTWQVYDVLEDSLQYEVSDPFTIVFNIEPLSGDLVVDGVVDNNDLDAFCYYWLRDNGSIYNDFYERADTNRDGLVDWFDFTLLANNWRYITEPNEPNEP